MGRLCERPGCSNAGTVSYGMETDDLVFWLTAEVGDPSRALCDRHADTMVVPRGWTLDDRRQPEPQLFGAVRFHSEPDAPRARITRRPRSGSASEQLVIDGTGETTRPPVDAPDDDAPSDWVATFDHDDDLDGMLAARSPLLSRAFRGDRRTR